MEGKTGRKGSLTRLVSFVMPDLISLHRTWSKGPNGICFLLRIDVVLNCDFFCRSSAKIIYDPDTTNGDYL